MTAVRPATEADLEHLPQPFYAQHGFVEVDADTPALRAVARHEDELGIAKFGARVLMRRAFVPFSG